LIIECLLVYLTKLSSQYYYDCEIGRFADICCAEKAML
jgi:hypothetical protein